MHHLILKKVWAVAAETPLTLLSKSHSLVSENLTQMRKKILEDEFSICEHELCDILDIFCPMKKSNDILFYQGAVVLSLIHRAENREECDSTMFLKDRIHCPNTRRLYAWFQALFKMFCLKLMCELQTHVRNNLQANSINL